MTRVLLAALLLVGCAPASAPPDAVPSSYACDFRMVDHNRRACAERDGDFLEPAPGTPSCGVCVKAIPMPSNR